MQRVDFWLHARSNCKWVTKWLLGWLEPRQGFLTLKFKSCRNLWFHPCQLHEDLIQGLHINIQMSILYYVKSQSILNIIQNSLFSNKHPFLHHGLFHHSRAALRRRQVHWQHRVCGGRMDWGRAWWKGRTIWMVENVGQWWTLDLMDSNIFFESRFGYQRHVNKAASYGFSFFEDSFQVVSVAQKHNFDSFWPGRQERWDSEWEVLLYQQAKVSNLLGLRVQKSIWNVPEKQVLLEFWPPKILATSQP